MSVDRWINMLCGTLLSFGALGFAIFLPDQIAAYDQEPEAAWLGGVWLAVLTAVAALCFVNGLRGTARFPSDLRTFANGTTIFLFVVLLVLAWDDGVAALLLLLCTLGPATALVALWFRRRARRS